MMLNERLYRRYVAGDGNVVRPASVDERDDFDPGDLVWCHDIVGHWLKSHPGHRAIRGWVAVSETRFDKHSVVDTGHEWIDVTPRVAEQCRQFFAHEGPETDFWAVMPSQQGYSFGIDIFPLIGVDDFNNDDGEDSYDNDL
jgi:hypothetical protein